MSKRPILTKRANRLRKAMRRSPDGYIDLVDYLKSRGHAQTTGEAEAIILAGRVRSESHKLGIGKGQKLKAESRIAVAVRPLTADDFEEVPVVQRHVPASVRGTIQVLPA